MADRPHVHLATAMIWLVILWLFIVGLAVNGVLLERDRRRVDRQDH